MSDKSYSKTKKVSFRVSEEEYKTLVKHCKEEKIRLSDLVRARIFLEQDKLEARAVMETLKRKTNKLVDLSLKSLKLNAKFLETVGKRNVPKSQKKLFMRNVLDFQKEWKNFMSEEVKKDHAQP